MPFVLFRKSLLVIDVLVIAGASLTLVTVNVTLFEKVMLLVSLAINLTYLIPKKPAAGVKLTIPVALFMLIVILFASV